MIASALEFPGAQQCALDAATGLLVARQVALRSVDDRGRSTDPSVTVTPVVGTGVAQVLELCVAAHEILSVRAPGWTPLSILRSHGANVDLHERGVRMTSLFDASSLENCQLLASLHGTPYRVTHGPVKLKVFDRRAVLMDGPLIDGEPTIVTMTAPRVVREALHYVSAVASLAVPVSTLTADPPQLTSRQSDVAELLAQDLSDEAIAVAIGVSVRTVRSEIAAILHAFGVRSRFAAGHRLAPVRATNAEPTAAAVPD